MEALARAGAQRVDDRVARGLEAPRDHVRAAAGEHLDRLEAAARRQVEVDERDLWKAALDRVDHRRERVRLGDLEAAVAAEQLADAGPEDRERLGDEDARAPHAVASRIASPRKYTDEPYV